MTVSPKFGGAFPNSLNTANLYTVILPITVVKTLLAANLVASNWFASIAQLVEQRPFKPMVLGSSPSGGTWGEASASTSTNRLFSPFISNKGATHGNDIAA